MLLRLYETGEADSLLPVVAQVGQQCRVWQLCFQWVAVTCTIVANSARGDGKACVHGGPFNKSFLLPDPNTSSAGAAVQPC